VAGDDCASEQVAHRVGGGGLGPNEGSLLEMRRVNGLITSPLYSYGLEVIKTGGERYRDRAQLLPAPGDRRADTAAGPGGRYVGGTRRRGVGGEPPASALCVAVAGGESREEG
jgi:hypothetical protein